MRVAYDVGPLESGDRVRGVGEYTRQSLAALKKIAKKDKNFGVEVIAVGNTNLSGYDLLHIPYFNPFKITIPGNLNTKVVVTIHDLIPLIYPKHYPPGFRGRLNYHTQRKRARKVDAVITDSESSKKDIVRFLGVKNDKIFPIYLAAGKHFKRLPENSLLIQKVAKKYKLPDNFVLYVGDINYNKNIPNLISACKLANIALVIVGKQALEIEQLGVDLKSIRGPRDWIRFILGKPHPELAHYKLLISEFAKNPKVIRTGFVSEKELVAIYNLATVYCQPSLYEGFGLPVLEAMKCATPVVVSKTQALVEIAGDAAIIADSKKAKDLAKKISLVSTNKSVNNQLIKWGRKRAEQFSWIKTARKTVEIYNNVVNKA